MSCGFCGHLSGRNSPSSPYKTRCWMFGMHRFLLKSWNEPRISSSKIFLFSHIYTVSAALTRVHTRVVMCPWVRVCVADPAFNSCRDPGTPAFGIPIMAQGFQVGDKSCSHAAACVCTEERFTLSTAKFSPTA